MLMRTICRGEKLSIDRSARNELDAETYEQLTLSVRKKKTEVNDKRIYRISRKFIGFAVSLSDKIYKKKLIKLYTII